MKVEIAFIVLLILIATACNNNTAVNQTAAVNQNLDAVSNDDPAIGCEVAARDYFATKRTYGGKERLGMEVIGISVIREPGMPESISYITVDGKRADGTRVIEQGICTKFTQQGKVYWRVSDR
jgi:hypothetical protein